MMLKNDSVSLQSLAPQLVLALWMVNEVYNDYGVDCVITSGNDSSHSDTSLHYSGNAVDIRTNVLERDQQQPVRDKIKSKLNQDFDVILETDHIHIEYQPKKRKLR